MEPNASHILEIASFFWKIPYKASHYPGNPIATDFRSGANCQLFAYELLAYYGKKLPPFRSSDLWEDKVYTEGVEGELEPLDLLLWNDTQDSYGAHVGVYVGAEQAIHLSKQVGFPEIRALTYFTSLLSYRFFIGAKRVFDT